MSVTGDRPLRPTVPAFRFKAILFMLAFLLTAAPMALGASEGEVIHEAGFDAGVMRWEVDPQGAPYPVLDGTRVLTEPGLPQLPSRELVFLVPLGQEVANIWIEPLETHREKSRDALSLASPHYTDAGEMVTFNKMNRSGEAFPASWGDFTGSHVWRGYRLATVSVYPIREIKTENGVELEFLDRYAVRMVTGAEADQGAIAVRQRLVPGEAEENAKYLANLVANPQDISGYNRQHGVVVEDKSAAYEPTQTPSLKGSGVTYLIITNDEMKDEFQVLADHKTAQGLPTVVATREFIQANYRNGADIQETMRMYILDAYQAPWC